MYYCSARVLVPVEARRMSVEAVQLYYNQRPVLCVNEPKQTGAFSARARSVARTHQ
jgi:hypothetical protein